MKNRKNTPFHPPSEEKPNQIKCSTCEKIIPISAMSYHRKYCDDCRSLRLNKYQKYKRKLPTGTTGATSELIVTADLLKRGFYVYRSVSANSPCDLIAEKNGEIKRIEVTTGNRTSLNKITWATKDKAKIFFDVLAIAIPEEMFISYVPDI